MRSSTNILKNIAFYIYLPKFIRVSAARRMLLGGGLLTAAVAGFFVLTQPAAMQSEASPISDSPAQPNALGKLAYQRLDFTGAGGRNSVLTANADGTSPVMLAAATVPPLFNIEPAWSPDGTKIVYVNDFGIIVMNADGSNKVNISSAANQRNPSWSVTNKIAFQLELIQGVFEIWTMNADGSNRTRFAAISQPSPVAPAWSPDGSKLAFASGGEIWVINADGTGERRVTNNSTVDSDPAWSPDGARIVFGKGGVGIAVINLDGTNETNLTNGTTDSKPAWSSDGTRIAFVRRAGANGGIFTMAANGANQIQVVADTPNQPDRNEKDNPAWQPLRAAIRPQFDFDGDGKADVSVFRPSNGFWYLLNSTSGFSGRQFGQAGDQPAPADYDGDGRTDIAVFRPAAFGYFYIFNSLTNTFGFAQFGTTGDVPTGGDWDGDGKADLAVYRAGASAQAASNFYYRPSGTPGVDFVTVSWGAGGDKPVTGDYDADGKTDAAIFRPANATWYVRKSSDNSLSATVFGLASDIPTPADFDGDGDTDVAVFRSSAGTWFTSQNPATNFGAIQFGANGDLPVPADYDGDGKADTAVFRPSNGGWYLNRTTSGLAGVQFGVIGDKPAPNAFVP